MTARVYIEEITDPITGEVITFRAAAEAEAVAYITCRKLGIDRESSEAFSPAYIAGWRAQKGADFQTALSGAVKAADTILDGDWPDNDDKGSAL